MKAKVTNYMTITLFPENDAEEALFRFWTSKEVENGGAVYGDGKVHRINIVFMEDKNEDSN